MALLLMLCMLLPQPVLAAEDTYNLKVSISDAGEKATGEVLSDTVEYLTGTESLVGTIASVVDVDKLEVFKSPAMKKLLQEGISSKDNGTKWDAYVQESMKGASGTLYEHIKSIETKVNALTTDVEYKISFSNAKESDAKYGVTYTITVELDKRSSSSGGGGGTGGGSAAEEKYAVNIAESENGSVHTSVQKTAEGTIVTITVTPEPGYRTNGVIVKDADGKQVQVTAVNNNTYIFTMPDSAVTVSASFILEPASLDTTGVAQKLNTNLAYMKGLDDGLFHPNDDITRGQVAMIFYRLLKDDQINVAYTKAFEDVSESAWYYDAVSTLAAQGIVKGKTETTFAPEQAITRAEFVAICGRFAEASAAGETFSDVAETHWAYNYITTASGFGWVNGISDGIFAPNEQITRAQAACIVNRMLVRVPVRAEATDLYDDVPSTYWAYYDIYEASNGEMPRPDKKI